MMNRLLVIALTCLVALSAFGAPAQAESESDGGYFDYFTDGGKIGSRFVVWLWEPHFPAGTVDYAISLLCKRYDANGELTGNNKVIVKDISFVGLDSDITLQYNRVSRKLGKFHRDGYLFLGAPDLELLADDEFVLAEVRFQVKGSSGVGRIKCSADVTESSILATQATLEAKVLKNRGLSVSDLLRRRSRSE